MYSLTLGWSVSSRFPQHWDLKVPSSFNKKLDQDESAKQRFHLNNTLISFQSIPTDLTEQFLKTHLKNIETIITSDTSDTLDTSDNINITNTPN